MDDRKFKKMLEKELKGLSFISKCFYFPNELPSSISLKDIIALNNGVFSERGKLILDILENRLTNKEEYLKLCWRVLAWLEFQDLLQRSREVTVTDIKNIKIDHLLEFNKDIHYCYYEATRTLMESLECGLNGYFHASIGLLRSFIELAVLEIYFKDKNDDYKSFRKWFKREKEYKYFTGKGNILDFVFSKDSSDNFLIIKERIKKAWQTTSIYVHKPRLDDSFTVIRKSNTLEPSIEATCYWMFMVSLILQSVLWLYVIKYPMSLFPVDLVKKFGYNEPVGIFFDESSCKILKRALGDKDFEEFKNEMKDSEEVGMYLNFYNNQPDKKDREIEESWISCVKDEAEKVKNIKKTGERLVLLKSKMRGMFSALPYSSFSDEEVKDGLEPINPEDITSYHKTKNIMSKSKNT